MKRYILASICLAVTTLLSCGKAGSDNPDSGSNAITLLTGSRWTFQKFEYENKDGTWIADPGAVDADRFTVGFNADNTYST